MVLFWFAIYISSNIIDFTVTQSNDVRVTQYQTIHLQGRNVMQNKKVLVVDDQQDFVSFLEAILEEQGLDVITANDGEAGLKKAKSESPDLVLLDVQMPKIDGFDVFRIMREDEKTKEIPIIMLTGIEEKTGIGFSKSDMKDFFHEEPQEYLEKPIEPEKVISAVKRALKI